MYAIFILGFFFFPDHKMHNNWFYILVLFPFIVSVTVLKEEIIPAGRLFFLLLLLSLYFVGGVVYFQGEQGNYLSPIKHIVYIVAFFLISCYVFNTDRQRIELFFKGFVLLALLTAVFSMIWFYSHNLPSQRLYGLGLLFIPVNAASLYAMALVISVFFLYQNKGCRCHKIVFYSIAIVIFLSYIVLSQNRSTLVNLAFLLLLFLLIYQQGKAIYALLGSVFLLALLIYYQILPIEWVYRSTFRMEIWQIVLSRVADYPWFGHTMLAPSDMHLAGGMYIQHAHNLYIATLYYGGIIGLLLLLMLVSWALYLTYLWGKKTGDYRFLALLVLGNSVVMFDYDQLFNNPQALWVIFWLPIIFACVLEQKVIRESVN